MTRTNQTTVPSKKKGRPAKDVHEKAAGGVPKPKLLAPLDDGVKKKKRRFRPGVQATREIVRQQRDTRDILARAPFKRVVREVADDVVTNPTSGFAKDFNVRFTKDAFSALQAGSESYLLDVFQRAQYATLLVPTDSNMAITLRPNAMRLGAQWVNEAGLGCDPRNVLLVDRQGGAALPKTKSRRKADRPVRRNAVAKPPKAAKQPKQKAAADDAAEPDAPDAAEPEGDAEPAPEAFKTPAPADDE